MKGKPHTQKKEKTERKQKHNSKKINQASNPTLSGTQLLGSAAMARYRFPIYAAVVLPASGHRQETLRVG